MNSRTVYVVTNVEAGWDCVRGVFSTREAAVARCAERDDTTPEEWNEDDSMNLIHEETLYENNE